MARGNLLLIDDEVPLLESLKALLEDVADKIWMADNGLKALEILKEISMDCIICDIRMPGIDGLEVIKRVRAMGLQTPFIFFTAHGNEDLMLEAVKHGAFDFVNKPYFDSLEEIVKNGLREGLRLRDGQKVNSEESILELQKLLLKKP